MADEIIRELDVFDLQISDVTLLSLGEAKSVERLLRACKSGRWWLRTARDVDDSYVSYVATGVIFERGHDVTTELEVRPVLKLEPGCLPSLGFHKGDKFSVSDLEYLVVSDDMAVLNGSVKNMAFNYDIHNGNDYETSDVKHFLDDWSLQQGFIKSSNLSKSKLLKASDICGATLLTSGQASFLVPDKFMNISVMW